MPSRAKVEPVAMFESVHQIGVYLHRFHNLDLFRQGWYQLKITIRWEDSEEDIPQGIPARVVQYEAPDLGPSSIYGMWRIDDTDNSFSTQPFRIKYARQDIHLSMMITFNLARSRFEDLTTVAAILKFELMYATSFENGANLQASLDASPASVHEYRIPPKALLGLHSYCPLHFDALHAVLVDVSVHVSLLKAASNPSASKAHRNSAKTDVITNKSYDTLNHGLGGVASVDVKNVMHVKALLTARGILLEELQRMSKAVDQAINISEFVFKMNNMKLLNSLLEANQFGIDVEVSGQGQPWNGVEDENGALDFLNAEKLHSLSQNELDNKTKILEFLYDVWAKDRKAEWSIWMVYSTVEMPHHYINSGSDESSNQGGHKRVSSLVKLPDEPPQIAATRAELHRRSIAQMQINNRSIQDMYIFGDPLRAPIVMVERVMNTPRRNSNQNSYLRHMQTELSPDIIGTKSARPSFTRMLKIVGHHLDLRLVRNQWLLIDPKIEVLMSEANEDKTSGDFREMGQRLAQEVVSFVKDKMDKASKYESLGDIKISFVGHSIGNLIIRTAISVSGPHLGYLYSSNSLFNSGLWFFKKLKNTQCIHQLTFTDDPDFQNTFLYKLCKGIPYSIGKKLIPFGQESNCSPFGRSVDPIEHYITRSTPCWFLHKTLEHFRNIILLSSPQDGYVPYHSARIESCPAASHDSSKKGSFFLEMLNDCLDQIRANPSEHRVFMRCDVNFDATAYGKNLNSFIGRAAHIEFLESDIFAKFIMWSFRELFQ
ncbi:hypothetical protein Lal_00004755 [Lupinus albus]|nr:hypothetical protein Lal_00004755 [Lupinus albus]